MRGMTITAKVFYIADKLQLFTKLGTLIPPIAYVLLYMPTIYQNFCVWLKGHSCSGEIGKYLV